jgi:hypothetical protein
MALGGGASFMAPLSVGRGLEAASASGLVSVSVSVSVPDVSDGVRDSGRGRCRDRRQESAPRTGFSDQRSAQIPAKSPILGGSSSVVFSPAGATTARRVGLGPPSVPLGSRTRHKKSDTIQVKHRSLSNAMSWCCLRGFASSCLRRAILRCLSASTLNLDDRALLAPLRFKHSLAATPPPRGNPGAPVRVTLTAYRTDPPRRQR